MFGLRQKLLLGFGGLLVILLTVSGLGVAVSIQHRAELDKFLYENWRSVQYGQKMVDAVDHLDEQVRRGSLPAEGSSALKWVAEFDANLAAEDHNITLPGEQEDADRLTRDWAGTGGYKSAITTLANAQSTATQRANATAVVIRGLPAVKSDAQAVVNLNLENMTPVEGRVKAMGDRASLLMFILAGVGIALAILFVVFMNRSILLPLRTLTRSAKEIEQGNLDLVVQINSRDELHQLAEAFNSMAAKLREFRRTNRAKLIRTQATTQLAINSLPDVVAIIGPEGRIEMANASARRLFALRIDAPISEMNLSWLTELFRKTSTDLLPVVPRGYDSAVQVMDDGVERFFLPHATPIVDEDRALVGVTVVLADVTDLRRLDEMKSGMLSVVSHELKTPLTSIRMGVHLLLEERLGALTNDQGEILSTIQSDSDRLQQIIENLLDMGRMESGAGVMDLKPHTVNEIVTDSTEPFVSAFRDRGVELHTEIPAEIPAILVDPARIRHVFSNLISNALKHTPPGGQVRITAAGLGGDRVQIVVADTGSGIPSQYLDRVFDRFFRVPGQTGATGAGLGLAIAKEIIELHGGGISVTSREGNGAKFTFTLPAAQHNLSLRRTGDVNATIQESIHAA
jgi:signal transduction histidine kinase